MTPDEKPQAFMGDTSREAMRVRYEALREIPAWRRLQLMDELTEFARAMTFAGLRQRHPECSEAAIEARYFELRLGPELARRVLGQRQSRATSTGS